MDEDGAYRLSIRLFEKIVLQSYNCVDELYDILEDAEKKCFSTGVVHRMLYHYRSAVNKLATGTYYANVVSELSSDLLPLQMKW